MADEVAAGHGLNVPYAWSYLTPAVANGLDLPRPAFDVWLPASSSLVTVPFVGPLGGDLAFRLAGALAGAALVLLVAMLARRTARAAGRTDRDADIVALVAAGLIAISQPLVTGSIGSDSQALFGVTAVAGVLAVEWALDTGRPRDLVLAGLVLGAGMLTRNETLYLVAAAVIVIVAATRGPRPERLARAALLAVVAAACYAPWGLRQWLVFGTPFPGQTAANAFSVSPNDIFGWSAPPPSLSTYLSIGPAALIDQRVTAFWHNLVDVALVPALPWSVVGIVGVVLLWRARPIRLLIATAAVIFLADTLVFPVSTLYGTFLHGSGARLRAARDRGCGRRGAGGSRRLSVPRRSGADRARRGRHGDLPAAGHLLRGSRLRGLGERGAGPVPGPRRGSRRRRPHRRHRHRHASVLGLAGVGLPRRRPARRGRGERPVAGEGVQRRGGRGRRRGRPVAGRGRARRRASSPIALPPEASPLSAFRVACTGP